LRLLRVFSPSHEKFDLILAFLLQRIATKQKRDDTPRKGLLHDVVANWKNKLQSTQD